MRYQFWAIMLMFTQHCRLSDCRFNDCRRSNCEQGGLSQQARYGCRRVDRLDGRLPSQFREDDLYTFTAEDNGQRGRQKQKVRKKMRPSCAP